MSEMFVAVYNDCEKQLDNTGHMQRVAEALRKTDKGERLLYIKGPLNIMQERRRC